MTATSEPAVWFPAVHAGTGTDVFTEAMVAELHKRGIQAKITWLPLRAQYAPWTVRAPRPPGWANIVHVNTWLHPRFIPRHLPVVATLHHSIHDPALSSYKGWLRTAYHRHWIVRIERAALQRADRVVAVSHFAARSAQDHLLDCPISVISNGIDIGRFQPPAQRQLHRPFRLLYVGSWRKLKGVDLLPAIMQELGDDFILYFTGGPTAEKDKAIMPANMHDLGRLEGDAVVTAMREADALLFPSRSEGFGLVAAEAMACGLPVIATRGSSLIEMIGSNITGLLCPQDDVKAFVSAARTLAADTPLYAKMSGAARKRAEQHFAAEVMLNSYIHTYNCVVRR